MAQGLSNLDAALKEMYLPSVLSTIRTKRVLQMHLDRDTESTDVSGRHARVPEGQPPGKSRDWHHVNGHIRVGLSLSGSR